MLWMFDVCDVIAAVVWPVNFRVSLEAKTWNHTDSFQNFFNLEKAVKFENYLILFF